MAPPISVYAELLQNIRQVSVAAASEGPAKATIEQDGRVIRVVSGDAEARLILPARVVPGSLPTPATSQGSLAWRLPLAEAVSSASLRQLEETAVPWPATALRAGSPVSCRSCRAIVVPSGRVAVWKDLPSENWAEMMEFWHCHKPGDHHHDDTGEKPGAKADDKSLASRGYGADSAISAQQGVGFVDLTSFLFAPADCEGVVYSPDEVLSCAGCAAHLGFFNPRTAAATLFKWQVSCTTETSLPTVQECLAAALIATTARTGSSKCLLLPMSSPDEPILHLWTLNNNIRYSSTDADGGLPVPASKLLYQTVSRPEADRMLASFTSDVQELAFLPAAGVNDIAAALDAANALLPLSERVFRQWRVGLLRRWEGKE